MGVRVQADYWAIMGVLMLMLLVSRLLPKDFFTIQTAEKPIP